MEITKIEIQKNNDERANLYLDEKFFSGISLELVVKEHLKVGMEIENGTFHADHNIHHTHEGSIGNLCNDRIVELMGRTIDGFHLEKAEKAQISSPQGPYPHIPKIPINIYKMPYNSA